MARGNGHIGMTIPEEEWPTAQPAKELPFGDGRVFHEHEDGLNDEEILPLWLDWKRGPTTQNRLPEEPVATTCSAVKR